MYSVVEIDVNIWAIFVGCISVLTGPHMWVIGAGHGVVGLDPIGSVLRTVKDGLRI